jgi:hypothetical protein
MNTEPTKDLIGSVLCPQCSAKPGTPCKVAGEEQKAFHAARIGAARRSMAEHRETQTRVAAEILRS